MWGGLPGHQNCLLQGSSWTCSQQWNSGRSTTSTLVQLQSATQFSSSTREKTGRGPCHYHEHGPQWLHDHAPERDPHGYLVHYTRIGRPHGYNGGDETWIVLCGCSLQLFVCRSIASGQRRTRGVWRDDGARLEWSQRTPNGPAQPWGLGGDCGDSLGWWFGALLPAPWPKPTCGEPTGGLCCLTQCMFALWFGARLFKRQNGSIGCLARTWRSTSTKALVHPRGRTVTATRLRHRRQFNSHGCKISSSWWSSWCESYNQGGSESTSWPDTSSVQALQEVPVPSHNHPAGQESPASAPLCVECAGVQPWNIGVFDGYWQAVRGDSFAWYLQSDLETEARRPERPQSRMASAMLCITASNSDSSSTNGEGALLQPDLPVRRQCIVGIDQHAARLVTGVRWGLWLGLYATGWKYTPSWSQSRLGSFGPADTKSAKEILSATTTSLEARSTARVQRADWQGRLQGLCGGNGDGRLWLSGNSREGDTDWLRACMSCMQSVVWQQNRLGIPCIQMPREQNQQCSSVCRGHALSCLQYGILGV